MNLRQYIQKHDIKVKALAVKAGVSQMSLFRIMAGKEVSKRIAHKVRKATGNWVSPRWSPRLKKPATSDKESKCLEMKKEII